MKQVKHYIVDVWVENDCLDEDTLDNVIGHALSNVSTQLQLEGAELEYNLTHMLTQIIDDEGNVVEEEDGEF